MTAANVVAYAAQVTLIVLACAGLPRLLGLRSPGVQYAFWRTLLAVCLLLPIAAAVAAGARWSSSPLRSSRAATASPDLPALRPRRPGRRPRVDWVARGADRHPARHRACGSAGSALGLLRLRRMRRRATDAGDRASTICRRRSARAAPILLVRRGRAIP